MTLEDILKLEKEGLCYLLEGFNPAVIGVIEIAGTHVALYEKDLVIALLIDKEGMTHEDALEYFEYNIWNGLSGDEAPFYATLLK